VVAKLNIACITLKTRWHLGFGKEHCCQTAESSAQSKIRHCAKEKSRKYQRPNFFHRKRRVRGPTFLQLFSPVRVIRKKFFEFKKAHEIDLVMTIFLKNVHNHRNKIAKDFRRTGRKFFPGAGNTGRGVSLTQICGRRNGDRARERGSGPETARIRGICTHNTSSV
jgi:hypothetical protein